MLKIIRRVMSFADWSRSNPAAPPPGDMLDAQFDTIIDTIDGWDARVRRAIRDDGKIAAGAVGIDALDGELSRLLDLKLAESVEKLRFELSRHAENAVFAEKGAIAAESAVKQAVAHAEIAKNEVLAAKSAILAQKAAFYAEIPTQQSVPATRTDFDDGGAQAEAWATASALWAEHMPDTLPDNAVKIMDVSGDHWSSRWWANKAANAFGELTSLYLGAHPVPPTHNGTGGPIEVGSIYYDTTTGQAMVWDGSQWNSFYGVQRAGVMTLWYNAAAGQTVFSLATPDLNGLNYTLDVAAPEGVEIHVNGLLAMPDPPTVGRWTMDAAANTITFKAPGLVAGDKVAIDILMPNEKLGPGDVYNWVLKPIVPDGVATIFGDLDTADAAGPQVTINRNEELLVSVDGVIQQPAISYNAIGDTITFTTPPSADSVVFIVWMRSTGGVQSTAEADDFVLRLGDTMTGDLEIAPATGAAALMLVHGSGGWNGIYGLANYSSAGYRWSLQLGDNGAETGGNAGSGFAIHRYADDGSVIDIPFYIWRDVGVVNLPNGAVVPTRTAGEVGSFVANTTYVNNADALKVNKAGDTMTGNLTITRTHATIVLNNAAAGQEASLYFAVAGNSRWRVQSNSTAESGGNTGSNLVIGRYTDANVFIDNPLTITRNTGIVDMPVGATTLTAAANDSSNTVATTAFATTAINRTRLRNRIVNSRMVISQERGTTGAAAAATGDYYAADQWRVRWSAAGATLGTNSTTPTPSLPVGTTNGNYLSLSVSTGKPTLAAGDYALITHFIEGYKVADLQWGTTSAKRVILRFWVNVVPGTYCISIQNGARDRSYITTFTIANQAWQAVTLLIPGDTTGTWIKDSSGAGMIIEWVWAVGTTYHGVAGWQATSKYGLASAANGIAVATFISLAEVSLYADLLGDGIPPPFEMEDYAVDLADCQRYWQVFPGIIDTTGYTPAGSNNHRTSSLLCEMRVPPAQSFSATTYSNSSLVGNYGGSSRTYSYYFNTSATGAAYVITTLTCSARMA